MADGVRKHARAAKNCDVMWAGETGGRSGRGKIVDISLTGTKLQLDQQLKPGDGLSIVCPTIPGLPSRGRVKWCRPQLNSSTTYFCGVVFEERSIDAKRWNDRTLATV